MTTAASPPNSLIPSELWLSNFNTVVMKGARISGHLSEKMPDYGGKSHV